MLCCLGQLSSVKYTNLLDKLLISMRPFGTSGDGLIKSTPSLHPASCVQIKVLANNNASYAWACFRVASKTRTAYLCEFSPRPSKFVVSMSSCKTLVNLPNTPTVASRTTRMSRLRLKNDSADNHVSRPQILAIFFVIISPAYETIWRTPTILLGRRQRGRYPCALK